MSHNFLPVIREPAIKPARTTAAVPTDACGRSARSHSSSGAKLTLNIIVECTVILLVSFEQSVGVVTGEVFELDETVPAKTREEGSSDGWNFDSSRLPLHDCGHELIDELVVFLALDSLLLQTDVQRIGRDFLEIEAA